MECIEACNSAKIPDPDKRSIANGIQISPTAQDRGSGGGISDGHRPAAEGIPVLEAKFKTNLARHFPLKQSQAILALCQDQKRLEATAVNEFVDLFVI